MSKAIHRRRAIRLPGYDYAQAGAYFVTICTQDRRCLFGDVADGHMHLNDAGRMIERWWQELQNKFPKIDTDEFVVMPNHIHGIVMIVGADLRVRPKPSGTHTGAPLPEIVQWFKTMTTNEYIRRVKEQGWAPLDRRLWQRSYYEHVVRNDDDLNRTRQYIHDNPSGWHEDADNLASGKPAA